MILTPNSLTLKRVRVDLGKQYANHEKSERAGVECLFMKI
jgi:hypothetical protein